MYVAVLARRGRGARAGSGARSTIAAVGAAGTVVGGVTLGGGAAAGVRIGTTFGAATPRSAPQYGQRTQAVASAFPQLSHDTFRAVLQ